MPVVGCRLAEWRGIDPADPAFFDEIVQSFLQDSRKGIADMRQAAAGDAESLRTTAHGIKGMCATVGAEGMRALCQELESLGAADTVAGASALIDDLAAETLLI
jgi:two-component system, sensor histidine kinase and response regulator